MPLDVTGEAERFQVVQVVGSAAVVERRDVVGFQAAGPAALNAAPAVPLEGSAAGPLPGPGLKPVAVVLAHSKEEHGWPESAV